MPNKMHHTIILHMYFLKLRIGLRLVGLNNYLDIAYRFKISRPK